MRLSRYILSPLLMASAPALPASSPATPWTWAKVAARAEEANADLRAARENMAAAEAGEGVARAAFLPSVSANYDVARSSAANAWSSAAALNARYTVFAGFADRAEWARARAATQASRASLAATGAALNYALKSAYADRLYAQSFAVLSAKILRRRQDNLSTVQLRFQSGRENQGSVLLSRAYLDQAGYDELSAGDGLRNSASRLQSLLASPLSSPLASPPSSQLSSQPSDALPTGEWELADDLPLTEPASQAPTAEEIAALTAALPSVAAAQAELAQLRAQRDVARAGFSPQVAASASWGVGSGARGGWWPRDPAQGSVGLGLSVPLFNGGATLYQDRAATARMTAGELQLSQASRDGAQNLIQSWSSYRQAVAKLRVDESFRRAAQTRAEIARAKYNNGLQSFEDWDQIENDLITRERNYLQSKRDRAVAEAAWEQSLGRGVKL